MLQFKFGKLKLGVVLLILIVICVWAYQKSLQVHPEMDKQLIFGADFYLTGNGAKYGEWARRGADLAIEQINASGGAYGQPVKIVYEDFEGDTSKAVSVYKKLKDIDKVSAILTQLSSPALAVQPYANTDKILQMDISASTPLYSTPDDYTFRVGAVATRLASESAGVLYNQFGARKVAVLHINNDFGNSMKNAFKSVFQGEIVLEDSFDQDSVDFRTQLTKVKQEESKIDYILLVGHAKESGLLVKQARDLGIQSKFFSDTYSVEGPDFTSTAGQAGEGLVFVVSKFDPESSDPGVRDFVELYIKKYGTEPVAYEAQAYDAVMSLAKAYLSCASLDSYCAKEELMKLDYPGASGRIKFDVNGDVEKTVGLKQVRDGNFVELDN